MDKIIEQSIEYLEKKHDNISQAFKEKQLLEIASPTSFSQYEKDKMIYLTKLYITRDRAFTYALLPSLNLFPQIYDLELMKEYRKYFKNEKKCLIAIRDILNSDKERLKNGSLTKSTCGLLLSTILDIHAINSRNLNVATNYYECKFFNNLNLGINNDAIIPKETGLVKQMIIPLKKELKK